MLLNLLEIILYFIPILLSVAYMTVIERKVIGSIQRRVGPNIVGYYGILQPFADALKLVVKEQILPSQSIKILFIVSPIITLVFSLLGWGVIPLGPGLALTDYSIGIFYSLAISSIAIYGIIFAGWSANSKYAFLGSLRSTAQMISYELIFSSCILIIIILSGSYNLTEIIEAQQTIWYIIPLFPIFIIFFISALAETNRTPFDLTEAESELVSGFITEHSGIIFVFFFLAEYGSIVLISTFISILFLGGFTFFNYDLNFYFINFNSIIISIKAVIIIFLFVWIRATLPRMRYDTLIVFCWTEILPLTISIVIIVPSFILAFDMILK